MRSIYILYFVLFAFQLNAQDILPADGSSLNYRQLLFEVPPSLGANSYRIEIAKCDKRAEQCTLIYNRKSKYRARVIDGIFDFNQTYKWSYTAYSGKKIITHSKEFVFYIQSSVLLDTSYQKLEYTIPNTTRKKGIIFIDGMKLAVDMQGKPVLFLNYPHDHAIRDINLTPQSTLTLVDNRLGEIKEMKLNGEMIWIGPTKHEEQGQRTDKFHHELEKLSSGNYLAAGKMKVSEFDESAGLQDVPGTLLCETIIEFDGERNEVWRFNLLPELKRQFGIAPTTEVFNPTRLGHLNGIVVDPSNKFVYASFKTFSTVFKIDKSANTIVYRYGSKKINFKDSTDTGLEFEQQHCPVFLPNGNLLIFNNGNAETGSGIVELNTKEPIDSTNEIVKKVYFKSLLKKDYYSPQMGSVQALDKNNILIGMGALPHVFEFNKKTKKINWQLYTWQNSKWFDKGIHWKPLISYRVFFYSSLFPHHFTVDSYKKNGDITLLIYNAGSEPDQFTIWNAKQELHTTRTILPGKKIKVKFAHQLKDQVLIIKSTIGKQTVMISN